MKATYKSTPSGVSNLGRMGDGVDALFVACFGSRAQRRMLARHLKREIAKKQLAESAGRRAG